MSGPGTSKSRKNKAKKARQKARRTAQTQDGAEEIEGSDQQVPMPTESQVIADPDLVEGHDTADDDQIKASEHDQESQLSPVDPPEEEPTTEKSTDFQATLVEGMPASKLQEYIPVDVDEQQRRMQFEPTQEQLTVTGTEGHATGELDPAKMELERRHLERETIHLQDLVEDDEQEDEIHPSLPPTVPSNVPSLIQGSGTTEDSVDHSMDVSEPLDTIVSKEEEIPEPTESSKAVHDEANVKEIGPNATEIKGDSEVKETIPSSPTVDVSVPNLVTQTTQEELLPEVRTTAIEKLENTETPSFEVPDMGVDKESADKASPLKENLLTEETSSIKEPSVGNHHSHETIGLGVEISPTPATVPPVDHVEKASTTGQFENDIQPELVNHSTAQTPTFPWDNEQQELLHETLPWEQPSTASESGLKRMQSQSPSKGPDSRPEELLNALANANPSNETQNFPTGETGETGQSESLSWNKPLEDDDFFLSLNIAKTDQSQAKIEQNEQSQSEPKSIPVVVDKQDKFAKLDDIFGDDVLDDLDNIEEKLEIPKQAAKADKLKSLAFLDDELLLDDDVMDLALLEVAHLKVLGSENVPATSEIQPAVSQHVPTKNHYLPTGKPKTPNYAAITAEADQFKQNLEAAKKKNDAYDFPGLPEIKPLRAASKYSNRAGSVAHLNAPPTANSSTDSILPPKHQTSAPPPASTGARPPLTGGHSSSGNSSFFLELPLDMPAKAARPPKVKPVMLPQIQKNQINAAAPLAAPPQAVTKPNPYAPKAGQGPPQVSPQITSGIVAPRSSFEPVPNSSPRPLIQPGSNLLPPIGLPAHHGPSIGQPIAQGMTNAYMRPPMAQSPNQHMSHPQLPNQYNLGNQLHVPFNQYNLVSQQQYGPNIHQSPVPNSTQIYSTPVNSGNAPRRMSNNQPQPIMTTNLPKSVNHGSATSPYVPVSGPYAPSSQRKTHSRASSLIGGKVGNPYAPVSEGSPSVSNAHVGLVPPSQMPLQAANTIVPAQLAGQPGPVPSQRVTRSRGISNARNNTYKEPKIVDPISLSKRQFPIFSWGYSGQIAVLIPNQYPVASNTMYVTSPPSETITVSTLGQKFNLDNAISQFPGPLTSKSKKKDVEKWLQTHIDILAANPSNENDILLNQILLSLVRCDSDVNSADFHKEIIPILNPSATYNETFGSTPLGTNGAPTAYKLDTNGLGTLLGYLQSGKTEEALLLAISRSDYAMALIIAHSLGPETFQRVASDYARGSFPFQNLQSKVHHLMPIIIKAFAGASASAVLDFNTVSSEGEWALQHWRDILAAVVANGNSQQFCSQFAVFLSLRGELFAADVCNALSGANGATIQNNKVVLMGYMYSEILEFAHHGTETNNFAVLIKLKHAQYLADFGFFVEAQRYIDYLASKIKLLTNQGEFGTSLIVQFQNLAYRLQTVTSEADQGWFGNKISKVKLDKMWGHLDKFIGGEELKETQGVFSKFSPSVLRTTSTVDLTLTAGTPLGYSNDQSRPQTSRHQSQPFIPHSHGEDKRRSSYANSSLPIKVSPKHARIERPSAQQAESYGNYSPFNTPPINSIPQPQQVEIALLSQSYARVPPHGSASLPHNELQAPSLTLLNNTQSRIHKKLSEAAKGTTYKPKLPFGNDAYDQNANGIRPPSLTDSQPNIKEEEFRHTHISSPVSVHSHMSRDFGPSSPLRLNEHDSRHSQNASFGGQDVLSNPPESTKSFEKYSGSIENFGNPDVFRQENHSPSIQSDISIDMVPKTFGEPLKPREGLPDLFENEKTTNPLTVTGEMAIGDQLDQISHVKTEAPIRAPPPPAAKQRANPYAPGGSAAPIQSRVPRRNKYGPPPGSNTAFVSPIPSKNEGVFQPGYGETTTPLLGPIKPDSSSLPNENLKNDTSLKPQSGAPSSEKDVETKKDSMSESGGGSTSEGPPSVLRNCTPIEAPKARFSPVVATAFKPPYEESRKESNTNIDTSFNLDDAKFDDSYRLPQDNQISQDNLNKFQTYNTFDEFSVPGSPDLTTRANSIVAGHHGNNLGGGGVLFSSRLSQSQQLAMYQQYEVQDDTVKDYIPIVEEDEEDEEVARKEQEEKERQERERMDEEERKKKAAAEKSATIESEAKKNKQDGGWFKFFGSGKDDDKPKPIKAKMGEKNAFVYDEKLKKWINKNVPLEEQLKESGPPPPPKIKKSAPPVPSTSNVPGMPPIGVPVVPPSAPQTPGGNSDVNSSVRPPAPPSNTSANSSASSLINAGLDDLLTLGKPTVGGARKGKRTSKRGYVNVLNQ